MYSVSFFNLLSQPYILKLGMIFLIFVMCARNYYHCYFNLNFLFFLFKSKKNKLFVCIPLFRRAQGPVIVADRAAVQPGGGEPSLVLLLPPVPGSLNAQCHCVTRRWQRHSGEHRKHQECRRQKSRVAVALSQFGCWHTRAVSATDEANEYFDLAPMSNVRSPVRVFKSTLSNCEKRKTWLRTVCLTNKLLSNSLTSRDWMYFFLCV